jgi:hypothetical protein
MLESGSSQKQSTQMKRNVVGLEEIPAQEENYQVDDKNTRSETSGTSPKFPELLDANIEYVAQVCLIRPRPDTG